MLTLLGRGLLDPDGVHTHSREDCPRVRRLHPEEFRGGFNGENGVFLQSDRTDYNTQLGFPTVLTDPIDLGAVGTNLSIRANTNPSVVGSVRFGFDGNAHYRTENATP